MAETTDRRAQRIAKLERLREQGIDPYPARVHYTHSSAQAIAAYEGPEGRSGQIKPGDRIEGYTVTEITRSGVTLQHPRTGEVQTLELRPRTERQEEPRPRRPRATGGQRGGAAAGGGRTRPQGGFPAAPPN